MPASHFPPPPPVQGSLGWEDLLKRHFHVVQPQAATHYMPDGHPARTVAFGDFGCVAHIYPSGRVEAYGQDTSEVAVRETATKACELCARRGGGDCEWRANCIV